MIEKLAVGNITWVHISDPTPKDLDYIAEEYNFHHLDLEDCRSKVQRPKLENYDDYKFLVVHFPVMQKRGYRLAMEEADIFWGDNYLITLNSRHLSKINEIFDKLSKDENKRNKYFAYGSDYLLYKILIEEVLLIFPLMNKISNEIDYLDKSFEKIKPSNIIERISALRRNIIFLQTTLKPQRSIFLILENQMEDTDEEDMDIYWGDVGDYLGKLIDMAEDYQELIDGLYASIDTLLTFRMNNIMKTLTLFSVIMLPLSFITGFYGMNIRLPLQGGGLDESYASILIVSGVMLIIAIVMILYFKIRRF